MACAYRIEAVMDALRSTLREALDSCDSELLEEVIEALTAAAERVEAVEMLNALLVLPNHRCHQKVARALQKIRSPSTIPFVRRVLEGNLAFLDYTCSESGTVAKWFSWILADIGTPDAIALMRDLLSSEDPGIREEMQYRLDKISRRTGGSRVT
jgi:HEAT repeat protein